MIMGKTGNGTEFDVIVIGGGATGAGTARDCAMRGLRVLLLERFDYTNGATGRNHGLLHSGARYAVNDGESAAECIRENRILRRIASHCVEENGGLFISLPEDDLSYQDKFVESCRKAGIEAEAIDPKEAIRLEPSVNPSLTGAVKVPDGSIDPFRLTIANILDARAHGAVTLTYQENGEYPKKPTQILISNPNIAYVVCPAIGRAAISEIYALYALAAKHQCNKDKRADGYVIDNEYALTFVKPAVAKDDCPDVVFRSRKDNSAVRIPLWLLGFAAQ